MGIRNADYLLQRNLKIPRRHVSRTPRERAAAPAPYRVEVPLVELLHGPLQLVPLRLPLLEVAHGLHGGPLPRGGPRVVVHVVHTPAVVDPPFPATARRQTTKTALSGNTSSKQFKNQVQDMIE